MWGVIMNIREYQHNDLNKIINTMCDAFLEDGLYKYFIEDEIQRMNFLKQFMKFRLSFGLKKGKVFVSEDCEGVVILIKPNKKMSIVDLIRCGGMKAILTCDSAQRKKIMNFNSFVDAHTHKNIKQPYWHISPICVSTQKQGNGYGSALIQYSLDYIKDECPCFLETQHPRNVSFYKKCGFQLVSDVKLPDVNIRNYAMIYSGR